MEKRNHNFPINHIALAVPNIEAAEEWYTGVLGFVKLRSIVTEDFDVNPNTIVFKISPENTFRKVKISYLTTGNSVGLELFEFIDPKMEKGRESSFETGRDYRRGGLFHMAITAPNVQEVCEKAIKNGGKTVGQMVHAFGEDGVYIQDPWGNGVEILSCSWEQLMCNRGD